MEYYGRTGYPPRAEDHDLQLDFVSETQLPHPSQGKIVTVFGSSRPAEGSKEYEDAELIGKRLSQAGISVCTGGYGGIMEAVSKGASNSDVKIIGVTSAAFSPTPNQYVNIQVHTASLYERLEKLVEIGDGYIVLKGATGTLVEFAAVWELMNKDIIDRKPIVLVTDFWKPVVDLMNKALTAEGHEARMGYVRIIGDAPQAAEAMIASLSQE